MFLGTLLRLRLDRRQIVSMLAFSRDTKSLVSLLRQKPLLLQKI
jgi:hypothetical protein